MIPFLANLVLAIVWSLLRGSIDVPNLVVGFVIGYLAILWLRPLDGSAAYVSKLPRAIGLVAFLFWELILSTLRVVVDVVSPHPRRRPGVVAIPLDAETDIEITLLANLVTLTPGTLSLDVSDDRRTLYVHAMFVDDPDELRRDIKDGFERRLLELTR